METTEMEMFKEELDVNIAFLRENVQALVADSDGDRLFALDLCCWHMDRGYSLSPKQLYRAHQFFRRVCELTGKEPTPSQGRVIVRLGPPPKLAQRPLVTMDVAKSSALVTKFTKAAETIKFPRIKLIMTPEEHQKWGFKTLSLFRRRMGDIGIGYKDEAASEQAWVGLATIKHDGSVVWFEPSFPWPELQHRIKMICEDITEATRVNGQRYGNCCFCGQELTNQSSRHHGYGPICAGNYGLPWGDVDEELALKELDI